MLRGEGAPGTKGGPKGDLYITVHIKRHNVYTRQDYNVLCDIPITFTQATLGAEIKVPIFFVLISEESQICHIIA